MEKIFNMGIREYILSIADKVGVRSLLRSLRSLFWRYTIIPYRYHQMQRYKILDSIESIQYIIDNKCSVSRYGDGEFELIWGKGNGFQEENEHLAARLKEILLYPPIENHIIGIPKALQDVSGLRNPYVFWPIIVINNYYRLTELLQTGRTYINASISRFYFERADRSNCAAHLAALRQIWEGRDIVIVEGSQSRSGVGNDLYDNAASLQRIIGPARNAFDSYDVLLDAVIKHVTKDKLLLLICGMTATVLAYDLAKLGFWAIDLGQVDVEYEWFRSGTDDRTAIKGKYVNEAPGGDVV